MCEFISYTETPDKVYFLTDALVPKALELGIDRADIAGHEAIKRVFGLTGERGLPPGSKERECTDFSMPENFPAEIVKALSNGEMTYVPIPKGLLRKPLYNNYLAERKPLCNNCLAKRKAALDADYEAKRKALDDEQWRLFQRKSSRAPAWRKV